MSPSQVAPGKVGKPRTAATAFEAPSGWLCGAPQAASSATTTMELRTRRLVLDPMIANHPLWLARPPAERELWPARSSVRANTALRLGGCVAGASALGPTAQVR